MHSLKSEQGELHAALLKPFWAEILIQNPSSSEVWKILKQIWQEPLLAETLTVKWAF